MIEIHGFSGRSQNLQEFTRDTVLIGPGSADRRQYGRLPFRGVCQEFVSLSFIGSQGGNKSADVEGPPLFRDSQLDCHCVFSRGCQFDQIRARAS